MLKGASAIYFATRKKHDQLWNTYVMRPLAAGAVAILAKTPVTPNQLTLLNLFIFIGAMVVLVAWPTWSGGLIAVALVELSYLFDCADGMLARHKKIASKTGHLFDFFMDESKATMLAGAVGVSLYRTGGLAFLPPALGGAWPAGDVRFLFVSILAVFVVASGLSLTNFIRRPELSGKETTVEAHYETNTETQTAVSPVRRVASLVLTFLRFLNHYPSHLWLFALLGRWDVFFFLYLALNGLYLAKGWLGLIVRFGRFQSADPT
jgi:phosphatidylglycerophosphate synthase